MLLKLIAGAVAAVVLGLVLLNALRPDLFRFESVGLTTDPVVWHSVDTRIERILHLPQEQLTQLPEEQHERVQLEGRDVLFYTLRSALPGGGLEVVVAAAVRGPVGPFSRPLGVAARGVRLSPGRPSEPLAEQELAQWAMNVSSEPFYEH